MNACLYHKRQQNHVSHSRRVRTLSGEEEGAFAWISLNYLNGFFEAGSKVEDYGVLETGGASTQVFFSSNDFRQPVLGHLLSCAAVRGAGLSHIVCRCVKIIIPLNDIKIDEMPNG